MSKVELRTYSAKSVAIFGDTKPYAKYIGDNNGKYNRSLTYVENGVEQRKPGWIFFNSEKDTAQKVVDTINSGELDGKVYTPSVNKSSAVSTGVNGVSGDYIDRKSFLSLLSRVEYLEQELKLLQQNFNIPVKTSNNVNRILTKNPNTSSSSSSSSSSYSRNIVYDEDNFGDEDDNNDSDNDLDNEQTQAPRFLNSSKRK